MISSVWLLKLSIVNWNLRQCVHQTKLIEATFFYFGIKSNIVCMCVHYTKCLINLPADQWRDNQNILFMITVSIVLIKSIAAIAQTTTTTAKTKLTISFYGFIIVNQFIWNLSSKKNRHRKPLFKTKKKTNSIWWLVCVLFHSIVHCVHVRCLCYLTSNALGWQNEITIQIDQRIDSWNCARLLHTSSNGIKTSTAPFRVSQF